MKTNAIILTILLMGLSLFSSGQEKKIVKMRIIKNINGKASLVDTIFETEDLPFPKFPQGLCGNDTSDLKNICPEKKKIGFNRSLSVNELDTIVICINKIGVSGDSLCLAAMKCGEPIKNPNSKSQPRMRFFKQNCDSDSTIKKWIAKYTESNTDNSVKQDEGLVLEGFDFYPNPNSGNFTLKFNSPESKNLKITIVDLNGRKVFKENVKNSSGIYNKTIDISEFGQGTYILQIKQNKKTLTRKIIVQ